ncbi:hypothetical protein HF086_001776 [Spodoptera exigua]|uniref:DNA helicase Pif1-like 2B domain-containing protein n=1 Tax=Spodoptera exigua TaxID=7107 RepID=A0A922LZX6_SPOEX|nr:hypothetical protein HF086_001776 [Spodoptera exigua]
MFSNKPEPDPAEINSDYLAASELLSQMFQGSCVNLNIAHDLSINGHFSRDQEGYPNLENESDNRNLNENRVTDIHRKIAPPVNIERERRMEELCWNTMYPDGKNVNALDESREAETYGKHPQHNVIPVDVNNCGGLLHSLKTGKGSRVMLIRNMAISDGLVNGAKGVIKNSNGQLF